MKSLNHALFSILITLSIAFTSCGSLFGEEIGRLEINEVYQENVPIQEISFDLAKGEKLLLWTSMDIDYDNYLSMFYTVEMWRDGEKIGGFQMNALETNPTMGEVKTTFGNKTSWSFSGKMDHLIIEEDGKYTFKAVLNATDNPSLVISKAELIFKK